MARILHSYCAGLFCVTNKPWGDFHSHLPLFYRGLEKNPSIPPGLVSEEATGFKDYCISMYAKT